MPEPDLRPEAARLYQQLKPVAQDDEAHDWAVAHLCAVLTAPIEDTVAIALDKSTTPGYSALLNLEDCPAGELPWLGQFNGTVLSGLEAAAEARRMIGEARGTHRGKPGALVSDLTATLTGAQHVQVVERVASQFENSFVVAAKDLASEAVSRATLEDPATKPLGTINTLVVSDDALWLDATETWAEVGATVTWANIKPGDI